MNGSIQLFAVNPKTLTMSTTIRETLAVKIYIYSALSHHNLKNAALITGVFHCFFLQNVEGLCQSS